MSQYTPGAVIDALLERRRDYLHACAPDRTENRSCRHRKSSSAATHRRKRLQVNTPPAQLVRSLARPGAALLLPIDKQVDHRAQHRRGRTGKQVRSDASKRSTSQHSPVSSFLTSSDKAVPHAHATAHPVSAASFAGRSHSRASAVVFGKRARDDAGTTLSRVMAARHAEIRNSHNNTRTDTLLGSSTDPPSIHAEGVLPLHTRIRDTNECNVWSQPKRTQTVRWTTAALRACLSGVTRAVSLTRYWRSPVAMCSRQELYHCHRRPLEQRLRQQQQQQEQKLVHKKQQKRCRQRRLRILRRALLPSPCTNIFADKTRTRNEPVSSWVQSNTGNSQTAQRERGKRQVATLRALRVAYVGVWNVVRCVVATRRTYSERLLTALATRTQAKHASATSSSSSSSCNTIPRTLARAFPLFGAVVELLVVRLARQTGKGRREASFMAHRRSLQPWRRKRRQHKLNHDHKQAGPEQWVCVHRQCAIVVHETRHRLAVIQLPLWNPRGPNKGRNTSHTTALPKRAVREEGDEGHNEKRNNEAENATQQLPQAEELPNVMDEKSNNKNLSTRRQPSTARLWRALYRFLTSVSTGKDDDLCNKSQPQVSRANKLTRAHVSCVSHCEPRVCEVRKLFTSGTGSWKDARCVLLRRRVQPRRPYGAVATLARVVGEVDELCTMPKPTLQSALPPSSWLTSLRGRFL